MGVAEPCKNTEACIVTPPQRPSPSTSQIHGDQSSIVYHQYPHRDLQTKVARKCKCIYACMYSANTTTRPGNKLADHPNRKIIRNTKEYGGIRRNTKEYDGTRRHTKAYDRIRRNTKECEGIQRNTKEYEGIRRNT